MAPNDQTEAATVPFQEKKSGPRFATVLIPPFYFPTLSLCVNGVYRHNSALVWLLVASTH